MNNQIYSSSELTQRLKHIGRREQSLPTMPLKRIISPLEIETQFYTPSHDIGLNVILRSEPHNETKPAHEGLALHISLNQRTILDNPEDDEYRSQQGFQTAAYLNDVKRGTKKTIDYFAENQPDQFEQETRLVTHALERHDRSLTALLETDEHLAETGYTMRSARRDDDNTITFTYTQSFYDETQTNNAITMLDDLPIRDETMSFLY
jgi:hypothetical protein